MKIRLSGDENIITELPAPRPQTRNSTVTELPAPRPQTREIEATPVIMVQPIPAATSTTEDTLKKIITWGSFGLLAYKFLKL